MSEADKMFEELGFIKIKDNEMAVIYKHEVEISGDTSIHHIMFSKIGQVVASYGKEMTDVVGFGTKLLQAINKKVEELGYKI